MKWRQLIVGRGVEMYVVEPHRVYVEVIREVVLFVVVLGSWVVTLSAFDADVGWGTVLCGTIVGVAIGRSIFTGVFRAMAYRRGWVDGRIAMYGAAVEAQLRGMTPAEWLHTEGDRTLSVLGIDPDEIARRSDESDER